MSFKFGGQKFYIKDAILNKASLSTPENDVNCPKCNSAGFILIEGETGFVEARRCSCLENLRLCPAHFEDTQDFFTSDESLDLEDSVLAKNSDLYAAIEDRISRFNAAKIPNLYLCSDDSSPYLDEILKWDNELHSTTTKTTNHFLFFSGGVGTGKTRSSIFLLTSFLKKISWKSGFYIPTYRFLDLKRRCNSYGFEHRALREEQENTFNWHLNRLRNDDFVVIDELGQEKLSEAEAKLIFDVIDHRYSAKKITILISNHCNNKKLSLDRKVLSDLVGNRIYSRLKSAKIFHFSGPDYRDQKQSETISKEEVEEFKVPAKILTHDEHEHQIMTWLTRNPAFEVVSTKKRKELTYIDENGEETDMDRPEPAFHRDVWVQGDILKIHGPVCDHEDKKLYALLVKELAFNHKAGGKCVFR